MRLTSAIATLLVVVFGAVGGAGDLLSNASRARRAPTPHMAHHSHRLQTEEEMEGTGAWKRSHWREMQSLLRHETGDSECCPSVLEMVAPKGGRTPSGLFVELYEDGDNKQRLYELSCAAEVVDKPCRFVDARLYNQSRCVQKYSYTYALVRNPAPASPEPRRRREGHFAVPGAGGWSMDYVRVRAGCECQVTPSRRRAPHRKRLERHRQRKRTRRIEEEDET